MQTHVPFAAIALTVFALAWFSAPRPVAAQSPMIDFSGSPAAVDTGETITLRWHVTGVSAVYLSGEGLPEQGVAGECGGSYCTRTVTPVDDDGNGSVTYRLRIILTTGSQTTRTVTVSVNPGGGGGGIVLPPLPHIPTPTEVLTEILAAIFDPIVDTVMGWVSDLSGNIATFARNNFSVDGAGLFGQLTQELLDAILPVVAPFMLLAFSLTMFQNMLERPLPGLLGRMLNVETVLGRIIILGLIVPFIRQAFGALAAAADGVAWGIIAPTSGDAWGWVGLLITPLIGMITGTSFGAIIIMALSVIALFAVFLGVVIFNNVLWVLVVAFFPFAAVAWLSPFTESLWSKYWWLVFKAVAAPVLLALMIRVSLVVLSLVTSNPLLGLPALLAINIFGASLLFKIMLAAAPVAIGAALTASGNPMGIPMVVQGVTNLLPGSRNAQMGHQVSQVVALSRRIDSDGE